VERKSLNKSSVPFKSNCSTGQDSNFSEAKKGEKFAYVLYEWQYVLLLFSDNKKEYLKFCGTHGVN
jgi:hypothetical protein